MGDRGCRGIAKYSHNPIEELGGSGDPFQSHLLANVLLAKKDQGGAAKYFVEAARSGKYPKDYKFAADIYFNQHNMAQVESLLTTSPNRPAIPTRNGPATCATSFRAEPGRRAG